jgi:hypothetical protein
MILRRRRLGGQRGQVVVIVAGGLIAIILAVGLIVDVGVAYSSQRSTQNGADASSRAGAVVLAKRAAEGPTSTIDSQDVWNAVFTSAATNKVTVEEARYTDWQGNALPGNPAVTPAGAVPENAAGVRVIARQNPGTYFVRVVGMANWKVLQEATVVAGPTTGCLETLDGCSLLPVAFPVTVFACTNTGKSQPLDPPQEWAAGEELTLPLCGGNPGSVGWIDWTPTAGGTSELEAVILNPPNVSIPLPSWQYITETGDVSALTVENAINTYAGEVVSVPFFDSTCNETPTDNELSGCPLGAEGGAGINQWYHVTKFLSFQLASPKGAYVNGNNEAECAVANAKECLKGAFVTFLTEGPVGAPCPPEGCTEGTSFSVQLIR